MRRPARILVGLLALVAALLLALGALPSLLGTGDPYYLTATEVEGDRTAVDAGTLSERRFPYTTTALAEGESEPYRTGPIGLKGAFTHSPFDELAAFRAQHPDAVEEDVAYVRQNGTVYRLEVVQPSRERR